MQDHIHHRNGGAPRQSAARRVASAGDVVDFASWVVALIAARRTTERHAMRADVLEDFRRVLVADGPGDLVDLLRRLPGRQVDAEMLADLYIPALARMFGEDWLDDRSTFADVSVASVRLQSMLRDLGAAWSADAAESGSGQGAMLLAVPPGEQHTLGAMVLLGQLRRHGVSVRVALGEDRAELGRIVRQGRFDGVFVSVSCTHRLDDVRSFVEGLRAAGRETPPVVAGGSALTAGVLTAAELAEVVGADAATNDLSAALAFCGLGEPGLRRRA
jgi:methylmalonyl-CoA mutase cobalamin-binding subunit